MNIYKYFDDRARQLGILDTKLAQAAAMAVMLVVAKLFPDIMSANIGWFVAIAIVCAIRPMYAFFLKR